MNQQEETVGRSFRSYAIRNGWWWILLAIIKLSDGQSPTGFFVFDVILVLGIALLMTFIFYMFSGGAQLKKENQ